MKKRGDEELLYYLSIYSTREENYVDKTLKNVDNSGTTGHSL